MLKATNLARMKALKKCVEEKYLFCSKRIALGTIQILRNQNSGWVRPNAYVCLHGGRVGVANAKNYTKVE